MPRGEAGRVAERVRDLLGAGAPERDAPAPAAQPSLRRRLFTMVPVRLDPGRRTAVAVGLAVLLAAVITGVWLVSARPSSVAVSATLPSIPGTSPLGGTALAVSPSTSAPTGFTSNAAAAPSSPAADVVVDVAGKVAHPGVYHLPGGSRVDDAVTAAGGAVGRVDLSSLNLAALLTDGQQISVGVPSAVPAPVGGAVTGDGSDGTALAGAIVDLNSASLDQLETLPGVGPVLGQHILDWRTQHGSFTGIDQLQDVSGIGDVKFAALRDLVRV